MADPGRRARRRGSTDQVGGYLVRIAVESGGRVIHSATAGIAVPCSPEYRFLGTDRRFLAELAAAGGGQVIADPVEALRLLVPGITSGLSLALPLLALAALLLPIDVAVRRLTFRPGDAAAWRAALRPPPPREAPPAPSEPTIGRLRRRVGELRGGDRSHPQQAEGRPLGVGEDGEAP